jgi:hypothetical protein
MERNDDGAKSIRVAINQIADLDHVSAIWTAEWTSGHATELSVRFS